MQIYLKNTASGLIPVYDSDFDEKKKLKIGKTYRADIVQPRNYEFHKKFFALLKLGCENSKNIEAPLEVYREYITMKSGHFDAYNTPKGIFRKVKSISFANMKEDEFQKVYNDVLNQIIIDTQATKEDIENNLINFM